MFHPSSQLAPHQVDFFNLNGFLWLDAITTKKEVEKIRLIYDHLFNDRVGWDQGDQFDLGGNEKSGKLSLPQLMNPSKYIPELKETLFVKNARAIAGQIFGADLRDEYSEHMIFKAPHHGVATPWHQDDAYHKPEIKLRNINFWMPLDDASVDNGCMEFVPQSFRTDVLPHHSIGNDPSVHGLEVDDPEQYNSRAVICPIPAGGCTMHASCTLHYAGANNSDRPRRAYILVFHAKGMARAKPYDNYWLRDRQTGQMKRSTLAAEIRK
ncbi:MAG TPA: phytanoyl-CoA dioxygenase family protein [Tepidisphaeraceae bacterium]|nr:phytanoyl-CoA dioxygenase family protein [Tepidisphaeraceae bacterium]